MLGNLDEIIYDSRLDSVWIPWPVDWRTWRLWYAR